MKHRTWLVPSAFGSAAIVASLFMTACGDANGGEGGSGGGGGATTSTTSPTTSTTTDSTTTCACAASTDCPDGFECAECQCVEIPGPCDGGQPCLCIPGSVQLCYTGPDGSVDVGICKGGSRTCAADGQSWGPCEGEVLPGVETCNDIDDDCDGIVDPDLDEDGWGVCDGDCCEDASCSDGKPQFVNLGAFEVPGDGVDNDCNPATSDSDPLPTCSDTPSINDPPESISAVTLVKAMDLCQFTTEDPPLQQKTWGVISATLTLADGSPLTAPNPVQSGVLGAYGPNMPPKHGLTMAALSSGTARAEGDPGFVYPQNGPNPGQTGNYNAMTSAAIPASWLDANGGAPPLGCGTCSGDGCLVAHDSVSLNVRMRVPTNAVKMRYWFDYYTSEYPEWLCNVNDDFFLSLIGGQAPSPEWPADGNVARDVFGKPISNNNAYLDVCSGCNGGTLVLMGTGMGGWNGALTDGAATGWILNEVPVTGGDTIDLRFVIWDGWDHNLDSLVLLDYFRFQQP